MQNSSAEPISLKFQPELGQKGGYLVTRLFTDLADKSEIEYGEKLEWRVSQRDSAGRIGLEFKQTSTSLKFDGFESKVEAAEPLVFKETRTSLGELFSRSVDAEDNVTARRYSHALSIVFPQEPVKTGSTWSAEFHADSENDDTAFLMNFALVKVELSKALSIATIKIDIHEDRGLTSMNGSGLVRIDIPTGTMIEGKYFFNSAPMIGDEELLPNSLRLTYTPLKVVTKK